MDVAPPVNEPGAVNEPLCGNCLALLSGRYGQRSGQDSSAWAQWLATSALVIALGTSLALAIRRIFAVSWSVSIGKWVSILLLGIPINLVMFDAAVVLTLLTT